MTKTVYQKVDPQTSEPSDVAHIFQKVLTKTGSSRANLCGCHLPDGVPGFVNKTYRLFYLQEAQEEGLMFCPDCLKERTLKLKGIGDFSCFYIVGPDGTNIMGFMAHIIKNDSFGRLKFDRNYFVSFCKHTKLMFERSGCVCKFISIREALERDIPFCPHCLEEYLDMNSEERKNSLVPFQEC